MGSKITKNFFKHCTFKLTDTALTDKQVPKKKPISFSKPYTLHPTDTALTNTDSERKNRVGTENLRFDI